MESGLNRSRIPSFFLFDVLPLEIQSRILGLLPITTLLICKAVSPSWRSLIRSPDFTDSYRPTRDPIFLLFSDHDPIRSASACLPSLDRWIHFPLPAPVTTGVYFDHLDGRRIRISDPTPVTTGVASTDPSSVARTLIFSAYTEGYAIINPFSHDSPLDLLPPVLDPETWHTALALIEDSPSDYTVVVIGFMDGVITQTYDSRSGRWEPRGLTPLGLTPLCGGSIDFDTTVWHEGLLYCLSRHQNHFLTFDLVSAEWSMLDVDFPMSSRRRHLLSFGGDLYLTAPTIQKTPSQNGAFYLEETPSQIGIEIWKLDQSTMIWREFDFYPCEFSTGSWFVVDCMGIISYSDYRSNKVLMCDLGEKRWWYSQTSTVPSGTSPWQWVGRTIQPPIDLLK